MRGEPNTTGWTGATGSTRLDNRGRFDDRDTGADGGVGRTVASVVSGVIGFGSLTGSGKASSTDTDKRLVVAGDGPGEHSYEIDVGWNDSIRLAAQAGGNDSISDDESKATGTLYHWNVDTYRFSGTLDTVRVDGAVSVHFPDGAYQRERSVDVVGQEQGKHAYEIASNSADIELGRNTGGADTDPDGGDNSDRTADRVTGRITNTGIDTIRIGTNPVQNLRVKKGHLRFS